MARRRTPRRQGRAKQARKSVTRRRKGSRRAVQPKARKIAPKKRKIVKKPRAATGRKRARTAAPRAAVVRRARPARKAAAPASPPRSSSGKLPHLDRARRTLDEPTIGPPSSLDLDRHPSAARSGRVEIAESRRRHAAMTPGITAGDPDADVENAYFSGEEAPGGDNSTPDQDVVEEIGRAFGVEYQDNEELQGGDELTKRDRHRWELDPASSDDYKDRD